MLQSTMSEPNTQFDSNFMTNRAIVDGQTPFPGFVPNTQMPSTSAMTSTMPPPLPPRLDMSAQNAMASSYGYGGMGMGGYGGGYGMGMGGYNSYGMGMNGMGMGGMGMGGMYGGYNRYGLGAPMYGDIESRFIHMAEESSRPAFDSIQSLVNAVGSVAMMLENTFFALTSSFRAILGVAENFGRLRSLFAQFWSTFAVIRTLNWMMRKLLVIMGIRTENEFKAWAEAVAATQSSSPENSPPRGSSWAILMFFGIVAAAPYIVLKMLGSISKNINENLHDPTTWQDPLRAVARHSFQAGSPQEVSFQENDALTVAPQSLQGHLWNSGWLMASLDRRTAGLVPVNYIRIIKPSNVTEVEGKAENSKSDEQLGGIKDEL